MKLTYYFKKLFYYLSNPKLFIYRVIVQFPTIIPDVPFTKMKWKLAMSYPLNLKDPKTFNEKITWLKLYDHKPEYTKMVDKYEVKEYVSKIIGPEHVIPAIGIYNSFDEIDFNTLPQQFVLKATHDSGGVVICKDKNMLDIKSAKKLLSSRLKLNYYKYEKEWPYKNVCPRILCEKYMVDSSGYELKDYKFFCFNGVVKFFKIDFDRFTNHKANYYDVNGNILPFGEVNLPPDFNHILDMPRHLSQMISFAEKLSLGIPFVRVDFYEANDTVYFGEITFYPASGRSVFTDNNWDHEIGSYLRLPDVIHC